MRDLFHSFLSLTQARREAAVLVAEEAAPAPAQPRDVPVVPTMKPLRRPSINNRVSPPKRKPMKHVIKSEYKDKISLNDYRSFQARRRGILGRELRRLIAVQELTIKARTLDYANAAQSRVEDALDDRAFNGSLTSSDTSDDEEMSEQPRMLEQSRSKPVSPVAPARPNPLPLESRPELRREGAVEVTAPLFGAASKQPQATGKRSSPPTVQVSPPIPPQNNSPPTILPTTSQAVTSQLQPTSQPQVMSQPAATIQPAATTEPPGTTEPTGANEPTAPPQPATQEKDGSTKPAGGLFGTASLFGGESTGKDAGTGASTSLFGFGGTAAGTGTTATGIGARTEGPAAAAMGGDKSGPAGVDGKPTSLFGLGSSTAPTEPPPPASISSIFQTPTEAPATAAPTTGPATGLFGQQESGTSLFGTPGLFGGGNAAPGAPGASSSFKDLFGTSLFKPSDGEKSGSAGVSLGGGSSAGGGLMGSLFGDKPVGGQTATTKPATEKPATGLLFGQSQQQPGGLFGAASATGSDGAAAGGAPTGEALPSDSLFGAKPTTGAGSLFGGDSIASVFNDNNSVAKPAGGSLFGAPPAGGAPPVGGMAVSESLFGGGQVATATSTLPAAGSIFGSSTTQSDGLFGGQSSGTAMLGGTGAMALGTEKPPDSIFGQTPNTTTSLFGGKPAESSNQPPMFGLSATQQSTGMGGGLFGSQPAEPPAGGGLFGSNQPAGTPTAGGSSLFGNEPTDNVFVPRGVFKIPRKKN